MWKSIPPQHSICPSSLASRACLSHRRRASTFSLAAFGHGAPPNKWLIWHGERFSEFCLCGLSSLMRSASSLLTAPGIPRFAGPSPKEEGDSKKRPHTHDANGYQATLNVWCELLERKLRGRCPPIRVGLPMPFPERKGTVLSWSTWTPSSPHSTLLSTTSASPDCKNNTPDQMHP